MKQKSFFFARCAAPKEGKFSSMRYKSAHACLAVVHSKPELRDNRVIMVKPLKWLAIIMPE
ncbi:hypothetical protein [Pantoea sp.]|uniref:hypothetical protein n=1 Tax=Pantoea sp. TaxID=69393 RepID=UPI0028993F97|nr:hypothetical protein [Pantoea sp.]